MTKFFIARILKTMFFCGALVFFCSQVTTAHALTISEIMNQGKVLGAFASNPYQYPNASLVKDGGTIYFISGTSKIPFTNYKAFVGLGYSLRNVVSGDLSNYTLAQTYFITTSNQAHPWGSWLSYKGVVYYSSQDGLIGVPSSEIFLSNGGQWNLVVKANSYDVAVLKNSGSLPTLTDADSRVASQPVFQFSNTAPANTSAPVVTIPTNTTPTAPVLATTTPTSTAISQVILPANVYASTTESYTVISQDTNTPLVYNFYWDDGTSPNSLSVNTAVHTYSLPGTYMLNIITIDNQQIQTSTTVPVTVVVPPSTAPTIPQFSLPSGVIIGQQITVTAAASDPNSSPLTYTFSWGDGTPDTLASVNSATHSYANSNTYVVKVTATNAQGFNSSNNGYIYIAP